MCRVHYTATCILDIASNIAYPPQHFGVTFLFKVQACSGWLWLRAACLLI